MSGRHSLRVAIYTRKSSEEGLEQDFNSLDAQREACEAFIASQKELGWKPLSHRYDDGGLSGGTTDRPALLRLLEEVKAKRVDIVVVYKIDRLTRSLMDFSRIVEIFDASDVSFVSVTQQFNTSTSMGRLTLNMLLSFAQFEREVTAERIRDKIAASKKKGMWMGGLVPLGYDAIDRKLVINQKEATTIRWLFDTYLELGSVRKLKEEADDKGIVSKARKPNRTSLTGSVPMSRGHLYRILYNPIYRGCIRHGANIYPGQHEAIIDETTFDRVHAMLDDKASSRRSDTNVTQPHLLTGLLYDETGDRMSPTHAAKKGRRYRYYISHRLMQAHRKEKDGWRLPAQQIETIVLNEITGLLRSKVRLLDMCELTDCYPETAQRAIASGAAMADQLETGTMEAKRDNLQRIIHRVMLQPDVITIEIDRIGLAEAIGIGMDREEATAETGEDAREPQTATIHLPIQLRRRGVEARLVLTDAQHPATNADSNLIRLLGQAHFLANQLTSGKSQSITELAKSTGSDAGEISRILPLAFLAPDIVRGILDGNQPIEMTAKRLSRLDHLPITWKDQRSLLELQ
ncbi:MAG: recombinase family protein [Nitratireductor sp.]|nr:recombinase family protein [Nitratireductor sp.]